MLEELKDPFELAIVTYALYVIDSTKASEAFSMFDALRYESELVLYAGRMSIQLRV